MICPHCQEPIPSDRIEAIEMFSLPVSCTDCSKVEAPVVLMNYDHKTGGAPLVVPNNADGSRNPELVRKAFRCHNRSR